ncbi:YczE/YyaS/YitT family protein [Tepidibacillus decaturensis]|uniref:YitT family protein n=1 Tax=Tepidibacillus decaturensis TaxID=1413211 RepID=A0A135L2B9_9BACI|nr:YitT family protein [Tepidibacillus decaturensis]KXG43125.1 hypothetical protein U473_03115 [Tepidibacillus decaturensis]
MSKHEWFIRMIIFFMGIIVMSLGISLIIEANLGVSAWDVLHIGLYKTLGLTVGTWSQIVGIVVIAVSYLMDKKILGIGTVLNMVFVGWFLDLFLYLLPTMKMIIPQITFLFLGIIFMGMGSGMYITSKLGPGPRDGLMLVLSERFHWGIGKIKTMMEMIALLIGWVLGGPVFIGTVIASVMIGPVMQFFIHLFNVRINKEREKLV